MSFANRRPASSLRIVSRLIGAASMMVNFWHEGELKEGQSQVGFAPVVQTSTCSAMARASSTSMPRYLTMLSIFVCPKQQLHGT
jgi:hypothetical protein